MPFSLRISRVREHHLHLHHTTVTTEHGKIQDNATTITRAFHIQPSQELLKRRKTRSPFSVSTRCRCQESKQAHPLRQRKKRNIREITCRLASYLEKENLQVYFHLSIKTPFSDLSRSQNTIMNDASLNPVKEIHPP